MFITPAFASAAPGAEASFMSFLPMIVIFVIFWFLMIRPQQKKAKEHQAMLGALQKGDEVTTSGGLLGRIAKLNEQYVTLEIAEGVEIVIQRAAIGQRLEKGTLKSNK
ncbi:preprotein translocase subunit YajC [Chitinibacter bivalviorum]|uniref:Sec translocon accessory complex subunit YajC n=1 Tax=Chitinibacter bivalviorum TaxID=2739434 RepID=A0A7H9BFD2_9NEIS|nr:preprotein translocase subunit YajC [Chitinibacter bivalviorum]QLG87410.1 preprotein translocase subunit YajC [Chitinibacter bivalviorum]